MRRQHQRDRPSGRVWKFAAAALASGAVAALAGSAAFACTVIMGALSISPTSGNAGTTISTSATGLKPAPATYNLLFEDAVGLSAGGSCMGSSQILVKAIPTNTQGSWTSVGATIPALAPQGVSEICGLEKFPVAGQTGTTHDEYTVIGGLQEPACSSTRKDALWRDPNSGDWYQCTLFQGKWLWELKSPPLPPSCGAGNLNSTWTDTKTGHTYVCSRDNATEQYLWVRLT